MKTMRSLAFGVAVLLMAGCATTFKPWQLSEIQEGQNREHVINTLGTPDFTLDKDGAEYLYYTYLEELTPVSSVSLDTVEGIEQRVAALDRTHKEYKYEVILVDGKVVNYKEVQD